MRDGISRRLAHRSESTKLFVPGRFVTNQLAGASFLDVEIITYVIHVKNKNLGKALTLYREFIHQIY